MSGLGGSGLAFLVSATSTANKFLARFSIADSALLEQLASDGSWGGSSGTVRRRPTSSATEADRSKTRSTVSTFKTDQNLYSAGGFSLAGPPKVYHEVLVTRTYGLPVHLQ